MDPSQADTLFSVIAVIVSDTLGRADCSHLMGCLEALLGQEAAPPLEIVVPYVSDTAGINETRARFPEVRFLSVSDVEGASHLGGGREHHDRLRARGTAAARGGTVALVEDHGRPSPSWAASMAEAIARGYAGVGGAIENGVDHPLNEAVYLCDFFRYQNPIEDGPTSTASDANVAYEKSVLDEIRSVWLESFREPVVNEALLARGKKLGLTSKGIVYQHREGLTLGSVTRERFVWGRSYAASRRQREGRWRSAVYAALSPVLPLLLSARIARSVVKKRRSAPSPVRTFAAVVWLNAAWSLGEAVGYLTGRRNE